MADRPTINFDPVSRESLRMAYEEAVAKEQDQFVWHGHTFVTGYAKYLLEYLDMVIKP